MLQRRPEYRAQRQPFLETFGGPYPFVQGRILGFVRYLFRGGALEIQNPDTIRSEPDPSK